MANQHDTWQPWPHWDGLATNIIGQKLHFYARVDSTNDVAWEAVAAGAPEGLVFWADEQTAGRGRQAKTWHSPPGLGIWMSVVLYPPIAPRQATVLSVFAAVAVAQAIRAVTDLPAMIKWPNDIYVQNRKVAGILIETRTSKSSRLPVVLGIGVNVNQTRSHFQGDLHQHATSLALAAGGPIDRRLLTAALLQHLDRCYVLLLQGQHHELFQQWRALSCTLGSYVYLREAGHYYQGRVCDIDTHYGLVVELDSGRRRVFKAELTTLLGSREDDNH